MWQENERLRLNGKKYMVIDKLGGGTFGEAWHVRRYDDDASVVLKRLYRHEVQELTRLEALCNLQLSERLPCAASVAEVIRPSRSRAWAGYFMPWAAGEALDTWLCRTEFNVLDNLCIAIQIAKTLADSHQLKVAHGDLHLGNVNVQFEHDVPIVTLIDWDNAAMDGLPPPPSPGALPFLAPESIRAYQSRLHLPPSIKTEQCSVAKTFHWLFFGRASLDSGTADRFEQKAAIGSWDSDPANGPVDTERSGGITNMWISPETADLFRRSLGQDAERRPSLSDWLSAMLKVVDEGVSLCPFCSAPMILAPRRHCPHCRKKYGSLAIQAESGFRIVAKGRPVVIGREELSSPRVSHKHAILTQLGPETFVSDMGSRNGTFRWIRDRWVRLTPRRRCPLRPGDRIRFGDVPAHVSPA